VQQRTREIGKSRGAGAQKRDIFRMVCGQGMRAALVGVAAVSYGPGSDAAVGERAYGVNPGDWITFTGLRMLLL